jgi:hypothetical protein
MNRFVARILWFISLVCVAACAAEVRAAEFMFRAQVDGRALEGKPLDWNAEQMLLLGRDGRLYQFNPKLAKDAKKTSPSFVGNTAAEMKTALQQEFDNRFEVSTTRHYVVVHPRGERDQWAERFEELYNRFGHYFRVRGFSLEEPPYPLVAIVFRDQDEYFRYAAASGTPMRPGTLGHYDPQSNRVFLFDITASSPGADWSENAETIIHEATHQTAYNVGVHRRFADEPRWLVEGLATMFEAPGVWNARYDHTQVDRVNRNRLAGFHDYLAKRRQPGALASLLSSDTAFRSDPEGAYAEAWALSFYLSETQPRLYAEYLATTTRQPIFRDYPAVERMADFERIFGSDLKLFDAKFVRYIEGLK